LCVNAKREVAEVESVVFLLGAKFRDRERDETRLTPGTTLVARVVYQRCVHAKGGRKKKFTASRKSVYERMRYMLRDGVPSLRHVHNLLIVRPCLLSVHKDRFAHETNANFFHFYTWNTFKIIYNNNLIKYILLNYI